MHNLQEANITDIVRSSQRDETFTDDLQEYLLPLLKVFGRKSYHQLRKYIHPISLIWYYTLTSLGNLQTLGEEYTGLVRTRGNSLPTKLTSMLWLISFIGGQAAFDITLQILRKKVAISADLTESAKINIIRQIDFIKDNKHIFMRMHHSIFYINGRYQNISNRLTGLRHVLTRDWLKNDDDIPTTSLRFLGYISLFYLVLNLVQKVWSAQHSAQYTTSTGSTNKLTDVISKGNDTVNVRAKTCNLCVDNRQGTSITPCGHLFCWDCIHDSLRYQPYCPTCRESVNSSRIVLLQNYC